MTDDQLQKMQQLVEYPFCHKTHAEPTLDILRGWFVGCPCGARIYADNDNGGTEENAIEKWNKR